MIIVSILAAYGIALSIALALAGHRAARAPVRPAAPPAAAAAVPASGAAGGRPKRVLVVGATGGTGREIVARALERGYGVTAFARDPSKLSLTHSNLTVVRGDVLDAASVENAVRGHDAILSALGHKKYFGPSRILSGGTANILRAMDAGGVRRLVCETSLGIGSSAGRLGLYYTFIVIPLVVPFYFWDKTRQERLVARSAAEWVLVRPGALTNGSPRGRYRHGEGAGSFLWTVRVSRADVADFMLDQIESDAYLRSAPGICW